jgi:hypothetical protein
MRSPDLTQPRTQASPAEGAGEAPSRLRHVSFGGTAAVVTSMGVIAGLGTAHVQKTAVVCSLVIIALADNLTDSLGVHVYQESERLPGREAFRATVANFVTRLLATLSFVALVILLQPFTAIVASIAWGMLLLSALSYGLALERGISPLAEIWKHCGVAVVVILITLAIGAWIPRLIGSS